MRQSPENTYLRQNSLLFCTEELSGSVWPFKELDGKIAGRRLEILAARGLDAKFLSVQEHRPSSKYRVKRRIQDTI